MMKEMTSLDKKIDNRLSAGKYQTDLSIRYSSTNKQNTDDIINGFLNDQDDNGEVNRSHLS